ncbi:DUF5667 domain-containing protein [Thermogemmatispora tikiterensis]|uniref:DUF5667 domain-containing protein n=1 Tax=Thermogemmatispora tikiterensis TaxID=1825093 RepID=A0A328V9E1_9CHLR|nr:DUF5667 domain-containing protein [Thermogemmatispora tikiterensis]RAQ94266.1 hypothetical protein A4R35_01900 [Thermogemmatispora tikiterensis]
MKPLDERLNDYLERLMKEQEEARHPVGGCPEPALTQEQSPSPDLESLVGLAWRLRHAPQLQVDPEFARQLERRLVDRYAELRQRSQKRRPLFTALRWRPALAIALSLCLLLCLFCTSLLVLAAQVTDPANPLYTLRRWEQHVEIQLSSNPASQATLNLQMAREQLSVLVRLADSGQGEAYQQGLLDLDRQVDAAASAIARLPAGPQRDQLAGDLAALKSDSIHELRHLLSRLGLPERLATTRELGQLGDTVPTLAHVTVVLQSHSTNGLVTITLTGSDLQPGAQLLVNGAVVEAHETQRQSQGLIVFVTNWQGNQRLQSLGILNPDGTVAQTNAIALTSAGESHQRGGSSKPTSTPTPHGNKPTVSPPSHGDQSLVLPYVARLEALAEPGCGGGIRGHTATPGCRVTKT